MIIVNYLKKIKMNYQKKRKKKKMFCLQNIKKKNGIKKYLKSCQAFLEDDKY